MEAFFGLIILAVVIMLVSITNREQAVNHIESDLEKDIEPETKKESEQDTETSHSKYDTFGQNTKEVDSQKNESDKKEQELKKLKIKYFDRKRKYPLEFLLEEKDNSFIVKKKGIVNGPMHKDIDVKFYLELWDITDGRETIQVVNNKYSVNSSNTACFEKIEKIRPYGIAVENWLTLTSISPKYLKFPRKGLRRIEFKIIISEAYRRRTITTISNTLEYYNGVKGYNDISSPKENFEEAVVKTAMLVSAIDGELVNSEADAIKTWIYNRIEGLEGKHYEFGKQRMNTYITDAYRDINENNSDIYDTLVNMDISIADNDRLELFQVCLDVAIADDRVYDSELEIIYDIADYLELPEKQYSKMIEKTLPINMHLGDKYVERILGIDLMIDPIAVRKHLLGEYKKWKNRVTVDDEKVRKQANQMIQAISKKREEYKI